MTKLPIKPHKVNNKKHSINDGTWDLVAASVEPLRSSLKNRVPEREVRVNSQKLHKINAERKVPIPMSPNELVRLSSLPELNHGALTGLDKSNAKKLRKGQHFIEGELDLHGMTQKQAHVAINYFIEVSLRKGKRCVLVITGKGVKKSGSVGVLRLEVPRWLNEEPNRSRVLAFSYAIPKDGGEGALYVMLKRKR